MTKEFVPFDRSLKLKELGFNESCLGGYIYLQGSGTFELAFYKDRNVDFNTTSNIYVSAPLYQQCYRWFREKYNLYQDISVFAWNYDKKQLGFSIRTYLNPVNIETERKVYGEVYETYEEAELACLDKLIELVENKK